MLAGADPCLIQLLLNPILARMALQACCSACGTLTFSPTLFLCLLLTPNNMHAAPRRLRITYNYLCHGTPPAAAIDTEYTRPVQVLGCLAAGQRSLGLLIQHRVISRRLSAPSS